ncbi:helix-turn-helix domain-containing protein, partial [Frankia sp. CiP3]|uniref:helix-turn-helix domain-containing protein n=1 Tax=Frankia sp. CiP3 TaxID=2880971 RepID=UPI0027DF7687
MRPAVWPPGCGEPRPARGRRGDEGWPGVKTLQAYRFALDPNAAQAANLHRHAGAARFAYNWGLAR